MLLSSVAVLLSGRLPPPVVWTELLPEQNASGALPTYRNTMPIGNGRIGANAFIDEDNAALALLLSSQEAFAETGEMYKVGWLRLRITPPPVNATLVEQRLDVASATMSVTLSTGLRFSVYAHAHTDTFVLEVDSPSKIDIEMEVQLVRPAPTIDVLPPMDCHRYNISADEAVEADALPADSIGWFHRNQHSDYMARTMRGELFDGAPGFVDTLAERQTGAVVFPDRAKHRPALTKPPGRPLTLVSNGASHAWRVGVALVTQEVGPASGWLASARAAIGAGLPNAQAHVDHWSQFWNRSHIVLTGNDYAQGNVSEKYALQRYVQALQARRHRFPIKFNGMLFQVQRAPNEDHRFWGSLNWWNNLRMPYYNMLASGDGDYLQTLFDGFVANMPTALARTRAYWPEMEQPAMFVPEYTHPLFGTSHPASYGCERDNASSPASAYPKWWSMDPFNGYNHQGALDLSLFALDHYVHTANATSLKAMLPHIDAVLHFYAQRWAAGANGQLRLWPTQGLETWQCPGFPPAEPGDNCPLNDMPTVAGLRKVTEQVLSVVPPSMSTSEQRQRWSSLRSRLPDLPVGTPPFAATERDAVSATCTGEDDDDSSCVGVRAITTSPPKEEVVALLPCEICPNHTSNTENAALYAVHPYRVHGIGRPTNLTLGLNAYAHRHSNWNQGWGQSPMDAAMLGMAEEASRLVAERAETLPAMGYRFPVFAPPCGDYMPSADHFSVMSNALTYMVVQSLDDANDTVLVLPAWPCAWDVDFRVHAPRGTVIAGKLEKGVWVGALEVTPESRRAHVKVMQCQGDA